VHGLDKTGLLHTVLQCVAQFLNTGRQRRVAYGCIGPDVFKYLFPGDNPSSPPGEQTKQGQRFWRYPYFAFGVPQALYWIKLILVEAKHPSTWP
jgi:hypothetical protein